uniref:Family 2 glycosyl transferase n=1 Tax=uncultured bacterium Contig224 TaxID=1393538 RepID=W0FMN3_9BACT|nr:family 2 glycosyl transferase [uncultured bacterium Contig224]
MQNRGAAESAFNKDYEKEPLLMPEKIITFAVPCYNSAEYMDHCIETLLSAEAPDVEIIIVDDGSTDTTPQKADEWAAKHPDTIRVIHQENRGHGGACMAGLREARGVYFKTVDSDDWVDEKALATFIKKVRTCGDGAVDLIITNYVIHNEWENKKVSVNYRSAFKKHEGRLVGWDSMGRQPIWHSFTMHAITFRRQLLLDIGLTLPDHMYYVDTVYTYVPLPYVSALMYLDLDLYCYFVGRVDQSTNVQNIVRRIDEHIAVTEIIIDAYELDRDVKSKRLRKLMRNQLTVLMGACTAYSLLSSDPEAPMKRMDVWNHLRNNDYNSYRIIRRTYLYCGSNYPGNIGNRLFVAGFHVFRKIFKFT